MLDQAPDVDRMSRRMGGGKIGGWVGEWLS